MQNPNENKCVAVLRHKSKGLRVRKMGTEELDIRQQSPALVSTSKQVSTLTDWLVNTEELHKRVQPKSFRR
jgi:hypothetical protein